MTDVLHITYEFDTDESGSGMGWLNGTVELSDGRTFDAGGGWVTYVAGGGWVTYGRVDAYSYTDMGDVDGLAEALGVDCDAAMDLLIADCPESWDVPVPPCLDDREHDWQSPVEIVGGIDENPGVFGHGGGVVIYECCMVCGCGHKIDTWAQDPWTGEQGLRSETYELGRYAELLAELASAEA